MSFSSLPPELVHQVIESTVPHTFNSTTYHERQGTLRRLALVSKLFRSIAQPLLLEIVWVKSVKEINNLPLEAAGGGILKKKRVVRWAVVELSSQDAKKASAKEVEESLGLLSSVSTLVLSSERGPIVDLAFLNAFSST
ncbi:hypothetical protein JCM5350_008166 [Sporobolomyces pararoseus]